MLMPLASPLLWLVALLGAVEGEPVYAHKVLCLRCTYFRAMLTGEMKESRAKTITLPDVRRPIFLALLEYLYTDEVGRFGRSVVWLVTVVERSRSSGAHAPARWLLVNVRGCAVYSPLGVGYLDDSACCLTLRLVLDCLLAQGCARVS